MRKSEISILIDKLAHKCLGLPQPIHVIAICSGGRTVGQHIYQYLKNKGVESDYFEAWGNIISNRAHMKIRNFNKKNYTGTALIAEDVIWRGTSVKDVKRTLYSMKKKKVYLAVLLDMNKKADFSIFN